MESGIYRSTHPTTSAPAANNCADRHRAGHLRWKFLSWCADSEIPAIHRLATAVNRGWPDIKAFIASGRSNAKSEGFTAPFRQGSVPIPAPITAAIP